jgi:hypothetical protein
MKAHYRFRFLPEMKQQKPRRRVRLAWQRDGRLESLVQDITHSAVSFCHDQPISGVTQSRAEMLPISAT